MARLPIGCGMRIRLLPLMPMWALIGLLLGWGASVPVHAQEVHAQESARRTATPAVAILPIAENDELTSSENDKNHRNTSVKKDLSPTETSVALAQVEDDDTQFTSFNDLATTIVPDGDSPFWWRP